MKQFGNKLSGAWNPRAFLLHTDDWVDSKPFSHPDSCHATRLFTPCATSHHAKRDSHKCSIVRLVIRLTFCILLVCKPNGAYRCWPCGVHQTLFHEYDVHRTLSRKHTFATYIICLIINQLLNQIFSPKKLDVNFRNSTKLRLRTILDNPLLHTQGILTHYPWKKFLHFDHPAYNLHYPIPLIRSATAASKPSTIPFADFFMHAPSICTAIRLISEEPQYAPRIRRRLYSSSNHASSN